jgi:hypothetical protein
MGVPGKDIAVAKNDGMASFGNITALAESPRQPGLIYAGTDDGNVQLTRDGGKSWMNVTSKIPGVPNAIYVSRVTPSAFSDGTVYLSFDGHRSNDFRPYLYVSTDFGNTWRSIVSNLPAGSVYTIKEDLKNQNLLFVGTEFGLFASMDRGATWTRWGSFPTVAVYDMAVHPRDNDLVVATHGRSFMIYDDITPLQQMTETIMSSSTHLFEMRPATQFIPNENGWFLGGRDYRSDNPDLGAYINYYLKSDIKEDVKITISDASGKVIRQLAGPKTAGLHRVDWDLRAEGAGAMTSGLAGALVLTNLGPLVLPGDYKVKLSAAGQEQTRTLHVKGDPMIQMADSERKTLYNTLLALTEMQRTANSAVSALGKMEDQIKQIADMLKSYPNAPAEIKPSMDTVSKQVTDLRAKFGRAARTGGDGGDAEGGGGGGGGGGGQQAIAGRINSLKSEIIGSQSLPTQIQSTRVDAYLKELNDAVGQLNTIIDTTLPNLFRQLSDNNIHPTFGDPVKPVTR